MAITARWGISPSPFDGPPTGTFSGTERKAAVTQALAMGCNNISFSESWENIETSAGVYNLNELVEIVEVMGSAKLQITVTVIDWSGNRTTPTYLDAEALNSSNVTTAYNNLINAIYAVVGANGLDVFLLGNEVEVYLSGHAGDIAPFAALITSAKNHIVAKTGWSDVKVSASFKHDHTTAATTTYAAVLAACTLPSFTYYPINGDFTVQYTNPATMAADVFDDLLALPTAVSGTVIITEIGFPSATLLTSSESLQGTFYAVLQPVVQMIADFDGIYSVNMEWLSDLPQWVLDFFVGLGDNGVAFLGSIGLRNATDNSPKQAYSFIAAALGGTEPEPDPVTGGGVWVCVNGVSSPPGASVQGTQPYWLWINGVPYAPAGGRRPAWPRAGGD